VKWDYDIIKQKRVKIDELIDFINREMQNV